jgi:hypothetical protein
MALEHLYELVEEVQDLQEAAKGSVEPDKVRALARLVLELAQAVEDIHDRLQKLEAAPPHKLRHYQSRASTDRRSRLNSGAPSWALSERAILLLRTALMPEGTTTRILIEMLFYLADGPPPGIGGIGGCGCRPRTLQNLMHCLAPSEGQ